MTTPIKLNPKQIRKRAVGATLPKEITDKVDPSPIPRSKEKVREEIVRCGKDPVYFIRKYVKIQHPVRGLIPFEMFDYQEQLVKDFVANRFNTILKARQMGISEVIAAYADWLIMFHRDKNVIVFASKAETAKNIIRKVKVAMKSFPHWLMLAEQVTDNQLSVELSNGSRIKAIARTADAGRSEAVSLLIIDEAAHVQDLEQLWMGLYPTVQAGGRAIVASTPNGVGNKFHSLYTDAIEGKNEFKASNLPWWHHPEHISDLTDDPVTHEKTSSWFREETQAANMGPREIAQELCCSFLSSGGTVLGGDVLAWIASTVTEPEEFAHWDRNLWVWRKPESGRRYMISVDVARGDGKDLSAAHVFDLEDMSQVAEYNGRIPLEELARLLCDVGRQYNLATLVVENNNVGFSCLEHIRLLGYEAVYHSNKDDSRPGEIVNMRWGSASQTLFPGIATSSRTRPLMVAKIEEYARNRRVMIRSRRFLAELQSFVYNHAGKAEAAVGKNDDTVTAAMVGIWIRDTFLAPSLVGAEMQKKLVDNISVQGHIQTDVFGLSKDPRFARKDDFAHPSRLATPMEIRLPNGQKADFNWLIDKKIWTG